MLHNYDIVGCCGDLIQDNVLIDVPDGHDPKHVDYCIDAVHKAGYTVYQCQGCYDTAIRGKHVGPYEGG